MGSSVTKQGIGESYVIYTIKPGDTLYNVAKRYETSLEAIFTANPGISPLNLNENQEITVPYPSDVVRTDVNYTYTTMERDMEGLRKRYPFAEYGSAGKSVSGRELYYIKLGNGKEEVFYNGAHHANEWMTSMLLMKFAENFLKAYSLRRLIKGFNCQDIWNKVSIYIIPMVNPDGVELSVNGPTPDNPHYHELLKLNNGSPDFSKWRANIRGVDLNKNYNADWKTAKKRERVYGVSGPSYTRYSGPHAESESETRAVVKFTREHDFKLVLAYHSQGRIIFWNYKNMQPPRAKTIGEMLAKVSGYTLSEEGDIVSYAGYKDWFIKEYKRPAYSIEVGSGKNPLPISSFDEIYNENIELLLLASVM